MKLGLFTALLSKVSLDEVIARVKPLGIEAVELGTGNYGKPAHIQLDLVDHPEKLKELQKKLKDAGPLYQRAGMRRERPAS